MEKFVINTNTWEDLKNKSEDLNLPIRGRSLGPLEDNKREAFVCADDVIYRYFLRGDVSGEIDDFDFIVDNDTITPQKTASELNVFGSSVWLTTHDFCDPTTWWQQSVLVSGEALSGSANTWYAAHENIIDMSHGKHLNEDDIVGSSDGLELQYWDLSRWFSNGHYLIPELTVSGGVQLTRVNDYDTDLGPTEWRVKSYESGVIETGSELSESPLLYYHYPTTNVYDIYSEPNKQIKINRAEVNVRNGDWDSCDFYFEVTLMGGIAVAARRIYKSEKDVIGASIDAPQTWEDWEILRWSYDVAKTSAEDVRVTIRSSLDMAVRLYTKDSKIYKPKDPTKRKPSMAITLYAISLAE